MQKKEKGKKKLKVFKLEKSGEDIGFDLVVLDGVIVFPVSSGAEREFWVTVMSVKRLYLQPNGKTVLNSFSPT